jgi:hypothetical protein
MKTSDFFQGFEIIKDQQIFHSDSFKEPQKQWFFASEILIKLQPAIINKIKMPIHSVFFLCFEQIFTTSQPH